MRIPARYRPCSGIPCGRVALRRQAVGPVRLNAHWQTRHLRLSRDDATGKPIIFGRNNKSNFREPREINEETLQEAYGEKFSAQRLLFIDTHDRE